MTRKYVDCRELPSESNCSLKISGEQDEVLDAAVQHAVTVHKHENTPELREQIRVGLKDDTEQPLSQIWAHKSMPVGKMTYACQNLTS